MNRVGTTGLFCLGLVACAEAGGEPPPPKPAPADSVRAARVEVATLRPTQPEWVLQLPGEVEGSRDATLGTSLGGYVERVSVQVGDTVKKGQSLAWVDRSLSVARLEDARAAYEEANAALARVRTAGSALGGARRESAEFALRRAEANKTLRRLRLTESEVRPLFDGLVAEVMVEAGEVVPPGGPIVRVVKVNPIHVSLSVSDRDVVHLKTAQSVQIRTEADGSSVLGKIIHIAPAADLDTRTFEVVAEAPNKKGLLRPGMIARVRVTTHFLESSLLIPQYVLVTRREGNGVFVFEDGLARWRPLKLGRVARSQIVVSEGLKSGVQMIVTGQRALADKDPVVAVREGVCCTDGRVIFGVGHAQ